MINCSFPAIPNYLYYMLEAYRMQIAPWRLAIKGSQQWWESSYNPIYDTKYATIIRAAAEMAERLTRKYPKLDFAINNTAVEGKTYEVTQQLIANKPFCRLLNFKKSGITTHLPKLLIVAPMAGHNSTLLKGTVQDTLPFFDVYITDWVNANQVPVAAGRFDMDDFIDYIIEFMQLLAPDLHVMAVCQPTVPVIAATSIMSANKDPLAPKSLILIGGPVDASRNPTSVNMFAANKDIEWFEKMLITTVPPNYPGYMRSVYPGFMQLAGFMSLDIQRHWQSHLEIFKDLLNEDNDKAHRQKSFYDEYLSVMDLSAEFYLQTIKEVFQKFSLAKGTLVSRNRKIEPPAISKCALLGIEGENDNIAGVGQTAAALELCKNIPDSLKRYHLQKDVGHYGVFSGSKFRQFVVPVIRDFVYNSSK